jgi:pimeloyl-ACP methyl ester carboxylesterase
MDHDATFVLVHGAWHGGWCRNRVSTGLRAAGARVFPPTLTGLGERAHLREPIPSLETHIQDVCAVLESEELEDVVLVGHSYAGMVITGVADRLRARIRRLVYLDAAVPGDGDDFASYIPGISADDADRRRAAFRRLSPDGAWLPVVDPQLVGVSDPDDAAWLRRRMTPHPLRTWLDPLHFANAGHHGVPKTYVLATDPPTTEMGYPAQAEAAKQGGEWTYREIACGHDLMVLEPQRTTELLLEAGGYER